MTLLVTVAAQMFASRGSFRSEKGVLPRIRIFCGKIDLHGISFLEKGNEMLSLVTGFISAPVSVARGLPRFRGMCPSPCTVGGGFE